MSVREITVQDTRTESETKQERLGTVASTFDGREYRYVKAGAAALDPGKLVACADEVANHQNLAVVTGAAGSNVINLTLGATAATADQYEDGWATVIDVTGEGIAYPVRGHAAIASSGTGDIFLETPIITALDTTSQVSLHNPFEAVIISAADQADMPVGVPNIPVTAEYYFWAQTKGFCAVWADEAVVQGLAVTTGSSVAGAVEGKDGAGEVQVGVTIEDLVDTEYRPIWLTLT